MKKRITLVAAVFLMMLALVFVGGLRRTQAGGQSCNGTCKRNLNACLATASTTSQAAQCKKSYQGCISSCK